MFAGPLTVIGEAQLKAWLIDSDRSLKTKANYYGLIHGVFAYAVKCGWLAMNPALGTAPKQSRVKLSRPELRCLTERELETALRLAKGHRDVLAVTVSGPGCGFGEISVTPLPIRGEQVNKEAAEVQPVGRRRRIDEL